MKSKKLTRKFFDRPTLTVAKELLGKFLVRKVGGETICGMITETEAYCGPNDLASHAHKGRTKRTEVMFGPPGHAYVYLIYGMYNCLNIVTEKKNYPAAVLIRATLLENQISNIKNQNDISKIKNGKPLFLNGPSKLCQYFNIDRTLNEEDITQSPELWLEDRGIIIKPSQIKRGKRIGVDYAGEYKNKLWRFFLK